MRVKMKAEIIEVVSDPQLRKQEKEVTGLVRSFYPECGRVSLYRTADGRVGFQMQVTMTPSNRKQLDKVYRAVMKHLGQKRGRPSGVETVQTKLHLPKPVYSALRKAAEDSHETMSNLVAESLMERFAARPRKIVSNRIIPRLRQLGARQH
jgi:hypothetical protein